MASGTEYPENPENPESPENPENLKTEIEKIVEEGRNRMVLDEAIDPIQRIEWIHQLWWHWANFELYIINPVIVEISPPLIIEPEILAGSDEREFVYPIQDYGHKLVTSKGSDMYTAGMSMCKLYYTIEKMIFLLVERLNAGGVAAETEVQVALGGFQAALYYAFQCIINLGSKHNVIVTNLDPGVWADKYLRNVKKINEKGYGYPSETPRDNYRQYRSTTPKTFRS